MKQEDLVLTGPRGRITVPGAALAATVLGAAGRIPGARARRPRRGIGVEIDEGRALVRVEIAARRGEPLPGLAWSVQEAVREALALMFALDTTVDVTIEEVGP